MFPAVPEHMKPATPAPDNVPAEPPSTIDTPAPTPAGDLIAAMTELTTAIRELIVLIKSRG